MSATFLFLICVRVLGGLVLGIALVISLKFKNIQMRRRHAVFRE